MRRGLIGLSVFVTTISLSGCSDREDEETTWGPPVTETVAQPRVEWGDMRVCVVAVDGGFSFECEDGGL